MKILKIDNSKKSAVKTGGWSNPGAKLYDTLLDAFYCVGDIPTDAEELDKKIKEGKYIQWYDYLKEAYLIAPISRIKNSPYGRTPYSKSDCAYPHHVVKGDKLIVSIPGLKAAYTRACQMHVLKGDVKDHLERHIQELGIQASFNNGKLSWNESVEYVEDIYEKMSSNFSDIFSFIKENMGIDLFEDSIDLSDIDNLEYAMESGDLYMENWVLSQKNFEINLDKWDKGNALWITGASGDGKSTLAGKMAKEHNAKVITSDIVLCRLGWTKEKFDKALSGESNVAKVFKMDITDSPAVDYVLANPDLPYECKDPETGFKRDIIVPEMINFFNWLIKELPSNPKYKNNLYIIEGCDICMMNPEIMSKLPLIIVGGSRLKSLYRRAKRDSSKDNTSIIKSIFKYLKNYNERFRYLDDDKEDFRKNVKKAIKESFELMDNFVNDELFRESYFEEKSHGKLKYDFRAVINIKDSHVCKVVYSLDNIEITNDARTRNRELSDIEDSNGRVKERYTKTGNTNHQSKGQKVLAIEDLITGKRLTEIDCIGVYNMESIEYICGKGFDEEKAKEYAKNNGLHIYHLKVGDIDNDAVYKSTFWDPSLNQIRYYAKHLSEDDINGRNKYLDDCSAQNAVLYMILRHEGGNESLRGHAYDHNTGSTFKSDNKHKNVIKSYQAKRDLISETLLGIKDPNYGDIIKKLRKALRNNDKKKFKKILNDYINDLDKEIDDIKKHDKNTDKKNHKDNQYSIKYWKALRKRAEKIREMNFDELNSLLNIKANQNPKNSKDFKESYFEAYYSLIEEIGFSESVVDEVFEDIETPDDLCKWMDCIQYGWISKKDQKVYSTGEDDDEAIFYKEYFLQSPASLINTKVGVCWDQTELERDWFKFYYTCNFAIIYIEIKDGDNCPTHTFLIYEDEEGKGTHWFEHSWGPYKGIHTYKNFKECIGDVIDKHQRFNKDTKSPVEIHYLRDMPRLNSSCDEFMKYAHKQPELIPSDWTPDTEWDDVFKGDNIFKEAYDLQSLPNILYFGTPNKLDSKTIASETPRGLFMSPYIGIASLFIIDRFKVAKEYFNSILAKNHREMFRSNYNMEYKEWQYEDEDLTKPLNKAHMYHNIPQFKEVGSGSSTGYIYAIDVSKVKNDLELHDNGTANREVIYKGSTRLPIKEVTEHKINWEITYRKSSDGKDGSFESRSIKESVIYECGIKKGIGIDGDDLAWIDQYLKEEGESYTPPTEEEPVKKSMPKQVDEEESDKNGVRRKKLYIAFIEWCKAYNSKNTFGSIFDKDAFKVTYPFVPEEMRYFYRLANPLLCVLSGDLTFFQASELRKLNAENSHLNEMMIFAATPNDVRVFNIKDKKVYRGVEENKALVLKEALASTFDLYIQNMIGKGDILNGPINEDNSEEES